MESHIRAPDWKLMSDAHPKVVVLLLTTNQNQITAIRANNQTDTIINEDNTEATTKTNQVNDDECYALPLPLSSSNSHFTQEEINIELQKIVSDCDPQCLLCCALVRQLSAHVAENHLQTLSPTDTQTLTQLYSDKDNEKRKRDEENSPQGKSRRVSIVVSAGGCSPNQDFSVTLEPSDVKVKVEKEIQSQDQEISEPISKDERSKSETEILKITAARRISGRIKKPVCYADNDEDFSTNDFDPDLDLSNENDIGEEDEEDPPFIHYDGHSLSEDETEIEENDSAERIAENKQIQIKSLNKTSKYFKKFIGPKSVKKKICYNCDYCQQEFISSKSYERHFREAQSRADPDLAHQGKNPYNCKTCGKGYLNERYFLLHLSSEHLPESESINSLVDTAIQGNMMCGICKSVFSDSLILKRHIRSSHGIGKLYECHICESKFDHKELLTHFELFHPGQLPFACKINPTECTLQFSKAIMLKIHVRKIHTNGPLFPCDKCSLTFTCTSGLKTHATAVHADTDSGTPGVKVKPAFNCEHCSTMCETLVELNDHKKIHVSRKSYICEVDDCWQSFSTKEILNAHIINAHRQDSNSNSRASAENLNSDEEQETGKLKPFGCQICKNTYKSSKSLNDHIREKHLEEHRKTLIKTFQCYICKVKVLNQSQLNRHMRQVHPKDKPFGCETCSKTFAFKQNLRTHIMIHTGEKPWKCSTCSFRTANACHLKKHKRTHTKERPYKCDLCHKTFPCCAHLKKHKLIVHEGKKPYMCDECGKCFGAPYGLTMHSMTHKTTADGKKLKPHGCKDCDARFVLPHQLRTHALIHSGVKPHMCEECGQRFRLPHQMRAHLKTHKKQTVEASEDEDE